MAVIFNPTHYIDMTIQSDDGTTLSYTINSAHALDTTVVDGNNDGNLDVASDYFFDPSFPYSGYTVEINGNDYAIFTNNFGNEAFIPYDASFDDLSAHTATMPTSTTTKNENGTATNFCFLTGTQIATPTGETAIEDLQIGDNILTADGRTIPVKWIGRQSVSAGAVNLSLPKHRLPVIVARGALGNHSDLLLSADHGLLLDGHIVNAAALVNGDTIRFATEAETGGEFTYWHIETEAHENIVANGIPAETFIDPASRAAFDNHDEYLDLYGTERIIPEQRLPRITSARMLPDMASVTGSPAAAAREYRSGTTGL